MKYIQDVKTYVQENLGQIELPNHGIEKVFGISLSKLRKDFKRCVGKTIREYTLEEKASWAMNIWNMDTTKTHRILMAEVNWDYKDRTFRKYFGQAKRNRIVCSGHSSLHPMFFKNREVILEIIFRFLLINEWFELDKIGLSVREFEVPAESSIFRTSIFPTDYKHFYTVHYNLEQDTLSYSFSMIRAFFEKSLCVPTEIDTYFGLLHNMDRDLKFEGKLTSAVKDWKDYIQVVGHLTMGSWVDYETIATQLPDDVRISLDLDSLLVQETEPCILELKKDFKRHISWYCQEKFGVPLDVLMQYCTYLRAKKYENAITILENLMVKPIGLKTLDLFLQLTDIPYLEIIQIDEFEMLYDPDNLKDLLNRNDGSMVIIAYAKEVALLTAEDFDYDPNKVLQETMEKTQTNAINSL